MWNEWIRKSDWEHVVYMVYGYEHWPKTNYKEIFDFVDRWAKKDNRARYFKSRTSSVNLVWDDGQEEFIALKIWYHIIIDESWRVRIFNQPTFEKLYAEYIPENVEYVFFNW